MLKIPKAILFSTAGFLVGATAVWYYVSKSEAEKERVEKKNERKVPIQAERNTSDSSLKQLEHYTQSSTEPSDVVEVKLRDENVSYEHLDKNSPLVDSLRKAFEKESPETNDENTTDENLRLPDGDQLRKEKLIGHEIVKVYGAEMSGRSTDSLAAVMAGVQFHSSSFMEVEYWSSPVHYRGYKMSKSKLWLFGYGPGSIHLYRVSDQWYMTDAKQAYALTIGTDFGPLKPLQDKKLSASLLSHEH